MKIKKGISYHPYDDKVFVHSVDTRKDYILEGIALDVLNFFAEHKGGSLKNLCAALSEEYDIDESELRKDLKEFVDELIAEEILCEDNEEKKFWTREVMREVENSFARKRKLFYMSLELTYRCVEKCIHCYIDDAPKFCAANELIFEEYKNILRQVWGLSSRCTRQASGSLMKFSTDSARRRSTAFRSVSTAESPLNTTPLQSCPALLRKR